MSSATTTTNPGPWKTRATRVLPSYRDLISDYLGMAQVILGFVTLVFSIVGFVVKSFTSASSSAMLTAVFLVPAGIFGVVAGMRKELWAVSCYMFMIIITMILNLVFFVSSLTALAYESRREAHTSETVREAIDICFIVLSLLVGVSGVFSLLLTSLSLCTDTCKCIKGAKYVEEPNVHYHHDPSGKDGTLEIPALNGSQTVATVSIPESDTGDIHSFENPQAISSKTDDIPTEQRSA